MQEFAFTLDLDSDPEKIARYRNAHERVWPEVIDGIRAVGILEEKIFLLGNRLFLLVVTDDGFDPNRDFERYLSLPRAGEWDELMRELQRPVAEAQPGELWAPMQKVFDLNWPQYRGDQSAR